MNKTGLISFHLDCYTNDKIRLLELDKGAKGFAVLIKLWQKIYAEKGYYCEWTPEKSAKLFLATWFTGDSGVTADSINEIVKLTLDLGIFDKNKYEQYGILTSHRIQTQYLEATSRRKTVNIIPEYSLVSVSNFKENVNKNDKNVYKNAENAYKNEQSKVKKSKVKESITDSGENGQESRFEDFWSAYPKKKPSDRYRTEKEYGNILFLTRSLDSDFESKLIKAAGNYAEAVKLENREERYIKTSFNFLKDGTYKDYLPKNYVKPKNAKVSASSGGRSGAYQGRYSDRNKEDWQKFENELIYGKKKG